MDDYRNARGCLTSVEREALRELAERCRGVGRGHLVNIGVEYGASLHCLRAGAPEARLYGIDLDLSKLEGDPGATLLAGDSTTPAMARRVMGEAALVFIDGGHDEATVAADLARWAHKVAVGDFLALHDVSDWEAHAGVVAALDAWRRQEPDGRWAPVAPPAAWDTLYVLRREALR